MPFRREPVVDLSSQGPGQWRQHGNWAQLALQKAGLLELQPLILGGLKSNLGLAAPLPPQRTRGPTSPPGLRFGPSCDPAPAGGAPRPQPGTRPHSAAQGTHFPEHNQVWHDRVGRGPNHRLPWPHQPPRGWSPAAGSAEKVPSWEPVMLWKSLLSS